MFDDFLGASSRPLRVRNPLTTLVSVGIHGLLISVLILVPFLNTAALPLWQLRSALMSPPPPPHAAAPTMLAPPPPVAQAEIDRDQMIRPTEIPEDIADIIDLTRPPEVGFVAPGSTGFVPSVRSVSGDGLPGGMGEAPLAPVPPPSPQPLPSPPEPLSVPLRVSSGVVQGFLIEQPPPTYPPLALRARIQGTVVLEAVISKEGRIRPESIRVIDAGHTLLVEPAVRAVRRWRYRPYVLNDEPVEVVTTIAVTYRLD